MHKNNLNVALNLMWLTIGCVFMKTPTDHKGGRTRTRVMLPLMWLNYSCHKLKDTNMPQGRNSRFDPSSNGVYFNTTMYICMRYFSEIYVKIQTDRKTDRQTDGKHHFTIYIIRNYHIKFK